MPQVERKQMEERKSHEGVIFPAEECWSDVTCGIDNAAALMQWEAQIKEQFSLREDPIAYLRNAERIPLAILRDNEEVGTSPGTRRVCLAGIGASHIFRLHEVRPAIVEDSIREIEHLHCIYQEFSSAEPRIGWIISEAIGVGFRLAVMRARHFERFAHHAIQIDEKRQRKTIVPSNVAKAFERGDSIRQIADAMDCHRSVIERYRKKWKAEKDPIK